MNDRRAHRIFVLSSTEPTLRRSIVLFQTECFERRIDVFEVNVE